MKTVKYADVISGRVNIKRVDAWIVWQNVTWDGAPEVAESHTFHTIGTREIVAIPVLPHGFKMVKHPSWDAALADILEGYKTASFDRLDLINIDLDSLHLIVGGHYGYNFNPLYYDRKDWVEWSASFDDMWDEFHRSIDGLIEKCVPCMPLWSSTKEYESYILEHNLDRLPIGNRINPPSLIDALKSMISMAESEEQGRSAE
jgi:hypothetical protein